MRPDQQAAALPDEVATDFYRGADVGRVLADSGLGVAPLEIGTPSSPAELRRAIESHRPLLLPGLAANWPALVNWTPGELVRRHRDVEVTALMNLPSKGTLFPQDQQKYEQTLPLAKFVRTMLTTPPEAPCYLAYKRATELFGGSDYDFGSLLAELDVEPDSRAWIGSAGTRSMLHSDLKDNLFCQIWGVKHVVLIPWPDSMAAYPFPDNIVNSQLDLARPDPARYPRLRRARIYAGLLRPGDVLYIPRGCWHDIRSCTPSVSLNHWFGEPLRLRDYLPLMARLGPRCWQASARDFVRSGLLGRRGSTTFFFSPPSTGRRLFDAVRWGNFSRANDPTDD